MDRVVPFIVSKPTVMKCADCGKMETKALPIGVVLAIDVGDAGRMAIERWPGVKIYAPDPWENVPPYARLMAIEADRQIF
jgi:hypothetical protein